MGKKLAVFSDTSYIVRPRRSFAVDPPIGSTGDSSQAAQLAQAMAGFTGSSGAGESLNTAPLSADTSQQTFLTTPHAGDKHRQPSRAGSSARNP